MEIRAINSKLYLVITETKKELVEAFKRPQEYFENPKLKGTVFSDADIDALCPNYDEKWDDGFNIPSSVLEPFYEGKFANLKPEEAELLDKFKHLRGQNVYIIGISMAKFNFKLLGHEIAHGYFATNEDYKSEVRKILAEIKPEDKQLIKDYLTKTGEYHEDVHEDETHAYLLSFLDDLKEYGIDVSRFQGVHEKLKTVFDKFVAVPLEEIALKSIAA